MKNSFLTLLFCFTFSLGIAQLNWKNVDSMFYPLPKSIQVFKTSETLKGRPNIAYYAIIDMKDKAILFDTDTTWQRRITPSQFYQKNHQPLIVVNCTFFSFQTNQNLSTVIKNGKTVSFNPNTIAGHGKNTLTYKHFLGSAIAISKNREVDVAWIYSDTASNISFAQQFPFTPYKDSIAIHDLKFFKEHSKATTNSANFRILKKWKMKTAVGGGPVLIQKNEIKISNNEELKFVEKAIDDKHPRTAIGFTKNNQLIILVIQGRFPGIAEGASLIEVAEILKVLECVEAINLDGGGSSCMLINGKETIKPSDKEGQRAVPAVFLVK